MTAMMGSSSDISVAVTGEDYQVLSRIGEDLAARIASLEDAIDVSSSVSEQVPQVAVTVNRQAAAQYGLTAAANIRHLSNADARTIPIIAMTANAFDDDIEKSRASGMNAHLAKPVDPALLYQTLYDFIFREGE